MKRKTINLKFWLATMRAKRLIEKSKGKSIMDKLPKIGERGKYTSKKAYEERKGKVTWFDFECIGHHECEAIIKTSAGYIHQRGTNKYLFEIEGEK